MTDADIRRAQAWLKERGHYKGIVDGDWGPMSREAAQTALSGTAADAGLLAGVLKLADTRQVQAAYTYEQRTGRFLSSDGRVMANGYSGAGEGLNNPAMETRVAVGPIPAGLWRIGDTYTSKNVGPVAIILEPVGHKAHGRTAFRIHGDNSRGDRSASNGCIILPRSVREAISNGSVRLLNVVRG